MLSKKEKGRLKKLHTKSSPSSINFSKNNNNPFTGIVSNEDAEEYNSLVKKKQRFLEEEKEEEKSKQQQQQSVQFLPNGPSIQIRSKKKEANDEKIVRITEGDDHRNILHGLLFRGSLKEKKRKHNEDDNNEEYQNKISCTSNSSSSIPSWAIIHNPALVQSIAVLEFNVSNHSTKTCQNNDGEDPIIKSKILKTVLQGNLDDTNRSDYIVHGRHVLYTKMRLIQDNNNHNNVNKNYSHNSQNDKKKSNVRPRHVTDVLMYSDKKFYRATSENNHINWKKQRHDNNFGSGDNEANIEQLKDNKDDDEQTQVVKDIYNNLRQMILTTKVMEKEGYPKIPLQSSRYKDDQLLKLARIINKAQQVAADNEQLLDWETCLKQSKLHDEEEANDIVHINKDIISNEDKQKEMRDCDDSRVFVSTCLKRANILSSTSMSSSLPFNVYALDCEMVRTCIGMELARISLIQYTPTAEKPERYSVILDSYVKPKNPILDYITQYSGITPSILKDVTTTLEEIQLVLLSLICIEDILIGHSLENDLMATRLYHGRVIDTAVLFCSINGRKRSLKHLSLCLLNQKIQQIQRIGDETSLGHDSIEDACTTLVLAIRRANLGAKFTIHDKDESKMNLMEQLTTHRKRNIINQSLYFQKRENDGSSNHNGQLICIGPKEWVNNHILGCGNGRQRQCSAHVLQCDDINSSSIKAISSYLKPRSSRSASLLWAKICVDAGVDIDHEEKINRLVTNILHSSSSNTVFLVVIQVGYDDAKNLLKQRTSAMDPRSTLGWGNVQEVEYNKVLQKSSYCDCYWVGGNVGK